MPENNNNDRSLLRTVYLVYFLDDSVISAEYRLTVEKKDITDSAVSMELKTKSLQGKANKVSPSVLNLTTVQESMRTHKTKQSL